MKKRFGLALMLVLIVQLTVGAYAALPDLQERKDTLTVQCTAKNGDDDVALSGVELSVAKVASVTCENGNVTYTLMPDYHLNGVNFAGMTASKSNEVAKKMAALQDEKKLSVTKKIADSKGKAVFSDLEHGMYLVRQTASTGVAAKYSTYAPFLVMVPRPDEKKGTWDYETTANPKTSVKKKKNSTPPSNTTPPGKTKTTPPGNTSSNSSSKAANAKTGDDTPIAQYMTMLLGAGMMIFAVAAMKRKRKNTAK